SCIIPRPSSGSVSLNQRWPTANSDMKHHLLQNEPALYVAAAQMSGSCGAPGGTDGGYLAVQAAGKEKAQEGAVPARSPLEGDLQGCAVRCQAGQAGDGVARRALWQGKGGSALGIIPVL